MREVSFRSRIGIVLGAVLALCWLASGKVGFAFADDPAPAERRRLDDACYGGDSWRPRQTESSGPEAVRLRGLKSWESFRDCPFCPEMKVIPSGEFDLGALPRPDGKKSDEEPRHRVKVHSFAISKYELEWPAFERFASDTGRKPEASCRVLGEGNAAMEGWTGLTWSLPGYVQRVNHPVVCVNWHDAKAYVEWLSAQTGKRYRLLSEAEWEYAARGTLTRSDYWPSDGKYPACSFGNFADTTTHDGIAWKEHFKCTDFWWLPAPVGSYRPNQYGVYDMLGNLWEWVEDCANPGYETAPGDGRPQTCGQCEQRMLRGASWGTRPVNVRFGNRARAVADHRSVNIGIRIARDLE